MILNNLYKGVIKLTELSKFRVLFGYYDIYMGKVYTPLTSSLSALLNRSICVGHLDSVLNWGVLVRDPGFGIGDTVLVLWTSFTVYNLNRGI